MKRDGLEFIFVISNSDRVARRMMQLQESTVVDKHIATRNTVVELHAMEEGQDALLGECNWRLEAARCTKLVVWSQ